MVGVDLDRLRLVLRYGHAEEASAADAMFALIEDNDVSEVRLGRHLQPAAHTDHRCRGTARHGVLHDRTHHMHHGMSVVAGAATHDPEGLVQRVQDTGSKECPALIVHEGGVKSGQFRIHRHALCCCRGRTLARSEWETHLHKRWRRVVEAYESCGDLPLE